MDLEQWVLYVISSLSIVLWAYGITVIAGLSIDAIGRMLGLWW